MLNRSCLLHFPQLWTIHDGRCLAWNLLSWCYFRKYPLHWYETLPTDEQAFHSVLTPPQGLIYHMLQAIWKLMSSINASIPDYLNVGSKHDGCPLQWRQRLWKQSCELFQQKQLPPNLWDSQIRWKKGELQSRFSQPLIFPKARGFASRDAAMNFASRHGDTWLLKMWVKKPCLYSRKLCQKNAQMRWFKVDFAVVTMVQGLSQQCCFATFFGNCCGQICRGLKQG